MRKSFDRFLKYHKAYNKFYKGFNADAMWRRIGDDPENENEYFSSIRATEWISRAFDWNYDNFNWDHLSVEWYKIVRDNNGKFFKGCKLSKNIITI